MRSVRGPVSPKQDTLGDCGQLFEQRPGLFQVERVEAFGKPVLAPMIA